jgi:hypothetical protein
MPDITMCDNEYCPLSKECYRFCAVPSEYQSYSTFEFDLTAWECKYFMQINPKEDK